MYAQTFHNIDPREPTVSTMGDLDPTETSPLLAKLANVLPEPADAPVGVLPTGNSFNGHTNGSLKPGDDGESQGDPERETQYEGMPEVKAKLKYIMPAIAIGVWSLPFWQDLRLKYSRFSCRLETRQLSCQATQR